MVSSLCFHGARRSAGRTPTTDGSDVLWLILKSLRVLAFEFADQNKIPHPFKGGMASEGRAHTFFFMKHHPQITVRAPELSARSYPRKRMNRSKLLNGARVGTSGMCSKSGWMNGDLFLEWLKFFVDNVKISEKQPALLIVANHESHRTTAVLECASSDGIIMLCVPLHTTHRLQPLDKLI